MGAKTRGQKKQEILSYIEETSENDLLSLDKENLISEFCDEHYREEDIEEIIEELVDKEPVEKGYFELELIYPKNSTHVGETLRSIDKIPLWGIYLIGFYFFAVITSGNDVLNNALSGATDGQIIASGIIGTISAYYLGRISIRINEFVEHQIPFFRRHKGFFYTIGFTLVTGFGIAWAASTIYSIQVPVTALVSIPATSVLAGAGVARYLHEVK